MGGMSSSSGTVLRPLLAFLVILQLTNAWPRARDELQREIEADLDRLIADRVMAAQDDEEGLLEALDGGSAGPSSYGESPSGYGGGDEGASVDEDGIPNIPGLTKGKDGALYFNGERVKSIAGIGGPDSGKHVYDAPDSYGESARTPKGSSGASLSALGLDNPQELKSVSEVSSITPVKSLQEVSKITPIQSIEEVSSITPVKSIQEVSKVTPIKSIQEVRSMQEVKRIQPVPDAIAKKFIKKHNLESISGLGGGGGGYGGEPTYRTGPVKAVSPPVEKLAESEPGSSTLEKAEKALNLLSDVVTDLKSAPGSSYSSQPAESYQEAEVTEADKPSSYDAPEPIPIPEPIPEPLFEPFPAPEPEPSYRAPAGDAKVTELKSVQEVTNMQEVKSIKPVKSIQEVGSIQEVKSMYELTPRQAEKLKEMMARHRKAPAYRRFRRM